jgi:hypothetical protein
VKGPFQATPCVLPKPPWKSENMRDVKAMKNWVKERLAVRQVERLNKLYAEFHDGVDVDPETWLSTVARPKLEDLIDDAYEATEGDPGAIEPLRKELRGRGYAKLAELIKPNRGRGDRRHQPDFSMKAAVEDVHFIRQLWRREFGHWRRRHPDSNTQGNPPFAEEIAAEFHDVDYDKLVDLTRR